jgi:hypothetical protein
LNKLIGYEGLTEEEAQQRKTLLQDYKVMCEAEKLTSLDMKALKECSFVPNV